VHFELTDLEGNPSLEESRIRISILQCIPINDEILAIVKYDTKTKRGRA
jgi:hypothetical protein